VLDTGPLCPGHELQDRAVISGSRVRVTNRHRERLEELFAG